MPPSPAELLVRFAEQAMAAGRPDVAGELLRQAAVAAHTPETPAADADAAHRDAVAKLESGDLPAAEAGLRAVVRAKPTDPVAHDHLGVAIALQKRFPEAEATFRVAAALNPTLVSPARNVAQVCLDMGKYPEAEAAFRKVVALAPADAGLAGQLAGVLAEQGKIDDAAAVLREFLARNPTNVTVTAQLGRLFGTSGRFAEAEAVFRDLVRLAPDSAAAHANLAAALGRQKRLDEAIAAGRDAVRLDPAHAAGWVNLGNALRDLGRLAEAADCLREAAKLDPANADAHNNLALALSMTGLWDAALPHYETAVRLAPDHPEFRFNRAIAYLTLGDFARGWPEYEGRWRTDQMKASVPKFPAPRWDGSDPAGKVVLLHTEQGLGDGIQFVRYAAAVAARGARVVVSAPKPLAGLFRTCPGVTHVVPKGDPLPAIDCHCPLMSLPFVFGTRLDTIPAAVQYLTAPPTAVAAWKNRLAGVPGFKVGLVWQGNPKNTGDRWRSVPLTRFAPLAAVPGVTLVSAQKGPGAEQLPACGFPVLDLGSGLADDLGDLAGLLTNLDLLVSVDTAVVHLAGALARPVWMLVARNNDWRWLRDRPDSPWYPTMRIFRQDAFADWDPVVPRVADELRKVIPG